MRVLVLESERHAADPAVRAIDAAGHEVVRCHEPTWQAFPCVGMVREGGCPMNHGVDVALVVRAGSTPAPSAFEDGARCAIRGSVPVVVAGNTGANPFRQWTVATTSIEHPVDALERAVEAPHPSLSAKATEALGARVRACGGDPREAWVRVYRRADAVRAEFDAPEPRADDYGVWVAGAVRALHPEAKVVDVSRARRVASVSVGT